MTSNYGEESGSDESEKDGAKSDASGENVECFFIEYILI